MKLFHLSWLLGIFSVVILSMLTRVNSPLLGMPLQTQKLTTLLVLVAPAAAGSVLGALSFRRREAKTLWSIGAILLNVLMLLAGITLLLAG